MANATRLSQLFEQIQERLNRAEIGQALELLERAKQFAGEPTWGCVPQVELSPRAHRLLTRRNLSLPQARAFVGAFAAPCPPWRRKIRCDLRLALEAIAMVLQSVCAPIRQ